MSLTQDEKDFQRGYEACKAKPMGDSSTSNDEGFASAFSIRADNSDTAKSPAKIFQLGIPFPKLGIVVDEVA